MSYSWNYLAVPWLYPLEDLLPFKKFFVVKHISMFNLSNVNTPTTSIRMPFSNYNIDLNFSLPVKLPADTMQEFCNMSYRISPTNNVWYLLETVYIVHRGNQAATDRANIALAVIKAEPHCLGSMLSSGPFSDLELHINGHSYKLGQVHIFLCPSVIANVSTPIGTNDVQYIYHFSVWDNLPKKSAFENNERKALNRVIHVPNPLRGSAITPIVKFIHEKLPLRMSNAARPINYSTLVQAVATFMARIHQDVAVPVMNYYYTEVSDKAHLSGTDVDLFEQLLEQFSSKVCIRTLNMTIKCTMNNQTIQKVDGELRGRKCTVLRYHNLVNLYHQKELVSLNYSDDGTIEHTATYIVPVFFIVNNAI